MKRQRAKVSVTIMAVFLVAATSSSHEMTDKYVPVGHYPELRSPHTRIGTIAEMDAGGRSVTLTDDGTTNTYRITEDTKIWLDRSLLKLENLDGSVANIEIGMKAEIKARGPERPDEALWVKLQVSQ